LIHKSYRYDKYLNLYFQLFFCHDTVKVAGKYFMFLLRYLVKIDSINEVKCPKVLFVALNMKM